MINRKLLILKNILGNYKKESSEQFLFFCPKINCNHHKKKLSINVKRNLFKCWICGFKGNNLNFLIRKYGSNEHLKQWSELIGENLVKKSLLIREKNKEFFTKIELPKEYIFLLSNQSYSANRVKKYLLKRGIKNKDILNWKIGYAVTGSYENRIIIPSFDINGNINYFVSRTYENHYIKYLNPKLNHDIVFNELLIDWNDDIVLVEGVFDAIKYYNAIPLLTSFLNEKSKLFKTIIEKKKKVFLSLDSDAKEKEEKIIKQFLKYGIDVYKIDINPYKDPAEMTKDELILRKEKAKKINKLDLLYYKLGKQ